MTKAQQFRENAEEAMQLCRQDWGHEEGGDRPALTWKQVAALSERKSVGPPEPRVWRPHVRNRARHSSYWIVICVPYRRLGCIWQAGRGDPPPRLAVSDVSIWLPFPSLAPPLDVNRSPALRRIQQAWQLRGKKPWESNVRTVARSTGSRFAKPTSLLPFRMAPYRSWPTASLITLHGKLPRGFFRAGQKRPRGFPEPCITTRS